MKRALFTFTFLAGWFIATAQDPFNYSMELKPVVIANLPGLHSYAFAQHDGKWLIIGGRKDGLHARTPFTSFPASENNTDIVVIDPTGKQFWKSSVTALPTDIKEQLQSTNMNFFQHNDTLTIIGGYGFSATANNHITHPRITTLIVSSVIEAIAQNANIAPYFKTIKDERFANTGGQLGRMGELYYLVGGQRFDGRYNPMNNPTFTQTYATEIKKFRINNSGSSISVSDVTNVVDAIHLRRRDYNLVPQIFPDGEEGYMISSGVFQSTIDLPFLYPVEIRKNSYAPVTTFNQYLSHYHSPKAALYDAEKNHMYSIFFGGLSQYYYTDGNLIKDDAVPFVKTISMVVRTADNTLTEYKLAVEMPALKGTGAEFIPNRELPHTSSEVIKLSEIQADEFILGYIYGGVVSPTLNPFTANQTSTTSADPTIYAVKLTKNQSSGAVSIPGTNPYTIRVYPNPIASEFTLEYTLNKPVDSYYFIFNTVGQIVKEGKLGAMHSGINKSKLTLTSELGSRVLFLTVVFENKFFVTETLLLKED